MSRCRRAAGPTPTAWGMQPVPYNPSYNPYQLQFQPQGQVPFYPNQGFAFGQPGLSHSNPFVNQYGTTYNTHVPFTPYASHGMTPMIPTQNQIPGFINPLLGGGLSHTTPTNVDPTWALRAQQTWPFVQMPYAPLPQHIGMY